MYQATERRLHPRTDADGAIQAWIFQHDGAVHQCRVLDFSRNGMLLDYPDILLPGMKLQVALAVKRGANVTRLVRRWSVVTRWGDEGIAVVLTKNPRTRSEHPRRRTS